MQTEARVGAISATAGSVNPLVTDGIGSLLTAQAAGQYATSVKKGNVYSGANQTGCIWTVGLATTYTGLALTNPTGSGKNLVILKAGFSERVAPGGIQDVWLAGGSHATAVTHSVAGTPRNMLVGTASSAVGLVDTGATLPAAPVYLLPLIGGKTSAALSVSSTIAVVDVGGLIVMSPGSYLIIATFTVGVAVGQMGCIIWEEIDE
jgi:hypothetical protein